MRIDELRFLVVDDHGFERWAIRNILTALGARKVFLAHDRRAAIEAFRKVDPAFDIVITDLDMPGQDGMELIRQLARERSAASVVVTSALGRGVLGTVKAMGDAYGVPVVAALEKPASMRGLREAIEQHAARTASPPPTAGVTAEEIANALRHDQIGPRFEPRVHMDSRRIVSAHVTPAWEEPSGGVTIAAGFMDVAKAAGLAPRLGWCVLRKALLACAAWRRAGVHVGICVPIGMESLRDPGYAQRTQTYASIAAVEPAAITLHFDAAPDGDGLGTMLENLSKLRTLGFGVAFPYGPRLRDVGELARVGCSELSIDIVAARSEWVERVPLPPIGLSICAYGIASRADWDRAAAMGAHVAAGPWLGAPLFGPTFARETARRPMWKGLR